jgi:hypothetical protein
VADPEGTLNEYGRDAASLPAAIPRPLTTPSGRPSLPLVKMLGHAGKDDRMGRTGDAP